MSLRYYLEALASTPAGAPNTRDRQVHAVYDWEVFIEPKYKKIIRRKAREAGALTTTVRTNPSDSVVLNFRASLNTVPSVIQAIKPFVAWSYLWRAGTPKNHIAFNDFLASTTHSAGV